MGTLSVSVLDDLKGRMINTDEVNWSAVARKAFEAKLKEMELFNNIVKKSKFTKKDADALAKKINKSMNDTFLSK